MRRPVYGIRILTMHFQTMTKRITSKSVTAIANRIMIVDLTFCINAT